MRTPGIGRRICTLELCANYIIHCNATILLQTQTPYTCTCTCILLLCKVLQNCKRLKFYKNRRIRKEQEAPEKSETTTAVVLFLYYNKEERKKKNLNVGRLHDFFCRSHCFRDNEYPATQLQLCAENRIFLMQYLFLPTHFL